MKIPNPRRADVVPDTNSPSKKILFVVNAHEFTAAHRLPILRGALEHGYVVECAAPEKSPAFHRLVSEGWHCHTLPLSRHGMGTIAELRSLHALKELYLSVNPDIVHHATIKPVLYGSLAARWAKVPAVVNAITGLGYVYSSDSLRARAIRHIVNRLYDFAFQHVNQKTIFQNKDDLQTLIRETTLEKDKTAVIPGSGVSLDAFSHEPEAQDEQPLVVFPARMIWPKGVAQFVAAASTLLEQGIQARFALVGDGDEGNPEGVPECQIEQWVGEGTVEWWGQQDDMPAVYRQAHIVVLPSYYGEGMPKVLMEAAASGRPVVTTDAPGCRDAVDYGVTGFLVPMKDTEALVERLRHLLTSPDMRIQMGEAARRKAEAEFSDTLVIQRTLNVYRYLLDNVKTKSDRHA